MPKLELQDWMSLSLTKETPVSAADVRLTCYSTDVQELGIAIPADTCYLGIDPGRNFGLTYISEEGTYVYNGKMPSGKHQEYGTLAYSIAQDFCELHCITQGDVSIIEGASYGDKFGQVGLAEIRFGFFLGLQKLGLDPKIVAPTSIRKVVFGSGKTQAMDVWAILNHNAADSFAIALYGLMKEDL